MKLNYTLIILLTLVINSSSYAGPEDGQCNDYKLKSKDGSESSLITELKKDYKPILKILKQPPKSNRGLAQSNHDIQLRNINGSIYGYFTFYDNNKREVASDLEIEIEIHEIYLLSKKKAQLLYKTKIRIKKEDFKRIEFPGKDGKITRSLAYIINSISIKNYKRKPQECFGQISLKVKNRKGHSFIDKALFLYI